MNELERTIKELRYGSSLRITMEQRDRIIKYLEELNHIMTFEMADDVKLAYSANHVYREGYDQCLRDMRR